MSEGSLGYYNSSSVLQELSLGSATNVLTVNGGATAPEWAAASGGSTLNLQTSESGTQFSTSSTSMVDLTNISSITLSGAGAGNAICTFGSYIQGGEPMAARWDFSTDGSQTEQYLAGGGHEGEKFARTITNITDTLSSQTVKMQVRNVNASTCYWSVDNTGVTRIYVLEVS